MADEQFRAAIDLLRRVWSNDELVCINHDCGECLGEEVDAFLEKWPELPTFSEYMSGEKDYPEWPVTA